MQPGQPERVESRKWAVSYLESLRPAWLAVRLLGLWALVRRPSERAQSGVVGWILRNISGMGCYVLL